MNDRTKMLQRANPKPRNRAERLRKLGFILAGTALGLSLGPIGFQLVYEEGALNSAFESLQEKSLSAMGLGSKIPQSVKSWAELNTFPLFGKASRPELGKGRVLVFSSTQYAQLLLNKDRNTLKTEILYQSTSTGRYVVYLEREPQNTEFMRSLPNYVVTLQSLSPSQGERDPRELMQWFHDDWSQLLGHRFPLTLDQKFPALQFERVDETRFWMRGLPFAKPALVGDCQNHNPMTPRTAWTQNWYRELRNASTVSTSSESFLLIHDSIPDVNHEDLAGQVSILASDDVKLAKESNQVGHEFGIHGTHTAGLLAAARNQVGVAGVVPGARINVVPFPDQGSGSNGQVTFRELVPSLAKLKTHLDQNQTKESTQIVLLSYAAEVESLEDGLAVQVVLEDILRDHDVLIVVPAGNRAMPGIASKSRFIPSELAYLLNRENSRGVVFPVGASDVCSRPAWFSNSMTRSSDPVNVESQDVRLLGRLHDVDSLQKMKTHSRRSFYAPGQSVYSTLPSNDYGFLSGTSAAAALTAGIAFAIAEGQPGISAQKLERMLEKFARPMKSGSEDYMIDSAVIVEKLSREDRYTEARADMKRSSVNSIQK